MALNLKLAAPLLLKCLAVLCVLDSVDGSNASHGYVLGSLQLLPAGGGSQRMLTEVLPTCGCSAELEDVQATVGSEFDASLEAQLEAIREFVGMTPPSSPPAPPSPPLA